VERADNSLGGLGIGLALARSLVHMHDGTIEARSAGIGQGAEFVVRLPIAADITVGNGDEAQRPSALPAGGRRLRVLVVDDNADFVEMLALIVEHAGHEVRKALDGPSAVSAALAYRPHVVFLDLGLPVMSGIEVARELRRHDEMAAVRLVALTGWGQAEDRRRTSEAGFQYHLTKPTEPLDVERLLNDVASGAAS
jgi:CheY-like chemotaxis protein